MLEQARIVANNMPNLADNIFINTLGKEVSSGNFVDKISDN